MVRFDDDTELVWGHILSNSELSEENLMLPIIMESYGNTYTTAMKHVLDLP